MSMLTEYAKRDRLFARLAERMQRVGGDLRTPASLRALDAALHGGRQGGVFISIGGGPTRAHSCLTNLNIGPFPNVDVVGDAHALPFADDTVQGVHCEAVLEHLERPDVAVAEMLRVLAPGGMVYAATPFLQAFHGYPDHFQGFTLTGHARLFERAGFTVVDRGVCVGPAFAIADLLRNFLVVALGGGRAARAAGRLAWLALLPVRGLDLVLRGRPDAHRLCSTTYVLASKPGG